ncbi:MAG: hypothetical protein IPK79_09705 [Vampirovibrionales bacterium]|nr:hypothetical protein [Vampirovibrionales bacterium]
MSERLKRLTISATPLTLLVAATLLLCTLAGCGANVRSGTLAMGHFYDGAYADSLADDVNTTAQDGEAPLSLHLARMARASELWTARKNPFMSKLPSMSGMAIESSLRPSDVAPAPGVLPELPGEDASGEQGGMPSSASESGTASGSEIPATLAPAAAPSEQAPSPATQQQGSAVQVVGIAYHPQKPMAILSRGDGRSQTVQRGDTVGSGSQSQRVAAIHKDWVDLVDVNAPARHRRASLETADSVQDNAAGGAESE